MIKILINISVSARSNSVKYTMCSTKEALPGVLGNRGKRVFISGEQGNKGQILRGTGEQRQYWGTGNKKQQQIFDFWGAGEQANLFQGTREQVPPRGGPHK